MREQSRNAVFLTLVILLLWGCFYIASLGALSFTSLLLGILISVVGGLIVGMQGNAFPLPPGFPRERFSEQENYIPGLEGSREELEVLRRRIMLNGGVAWERLSFPTDPGRRVPGIEEDPASRVLEEEVRGSLLSRFEAVWEQALKEFDPGTGDVLLSSVSSTRLAKEFLPGTMSMSASGGLTDPGDQDGLPEDVLIRREAVETRAAPDRTIYTRTIQALMRKDGVCEYRILGKEPRRIWYPYERATVNSS